MAAKKSNPVLQLIARMVDDQRLRTLSDAELLGRFLEQQDEAALHGLVRRHGPMVLDVCRSVLHNAADAEDAFQATFMVLASKGSSVRKAASVGCWLHGVAYRIACNARRRTAARRRCESQVAAPEATQADDLTWQEVRGIVHEELSGLGESYRAPLVLCYLEGKTHAEAATQLSLPLGTLKGRLERGRAMLRSRLVRRGLGPTAYVVTAAWPASAPSASVPNLLGAHTVKAAGAFAADQAATVLRPELIALASEVLKTMLYTKLKVAALVMLVTATLGSGATLATLPGRAGPPRESQSAGPGIAAAGTRGERPSPKAATAGAKAGAPYEGAVLDQASGKPVAGVKVIVRRLIKGEAAGEVRLASDKDGRFRFDPPLSWAEPADARIAVAVEAPPGYIGLPSRKDFGFPTEDGVTVDRLRIQKELGVRPFFDRILLFSTKKITGRLVDPEGKPASGVQVVACSRHLKDKAILPHRLVRRVKTDAEGRFTAEVASPGTVVLYFLPERFAARYVKLTDPAGDLGTYKLQAGVEVAGKLRDVKNQPLPGRWVRVGTSDYDYDLWGIGIGGFARWCRTGPGGTFRTAPLPPGEYEVSAHGIDRKPGVGEAYAEANPAWDYLLGRERLGEPLEACVLSQKVKVRAGKAPLVVLRAVPHVNVEMRVVDRDGKPIDGVSFTYNFIFDGTDYPVGHPVARSGKVVIRVPHGATHFYAYVLPPGPADICILRPTKGVIDLLLGVQLMNLEEDTTVNFVYVRGVDTSVRISAKDGSPLQDVEVKADHPNTGDGKGKITIANRPISCLPTGDGVYWMWGVMADRPLVLKVRAKGYEVVTRTVTLAAGAPRRLEIVLDKKKEKTK